MLPFIVVTSSVTTLNKTSRKISVTWHASVYWARLGLWIRVGPHPRLVGGANLWVVRVSTEMSIPDLFIGFTVDDVNGFVNRFRTETKIQQMVSSFLRKDFASAHFFPNSINNNSKGSVKE